MNSNSAPIQWVMIHIVIVRGSGSRSMAWNLRFKIEIKFKIFNFSWISFIECFYCLIFPLSTMNKLIFLSIYLGQSFKVTLFLIICWYLFIIIILITFHSEFFDSMVIRNSIQINFYLIISTNSNQIWSEKKSKFLDILELTLEYLQISTYRIKLGLY